jgi:hypothetical protein
MDRLFRDLRTVLKGFNRDEQNSFEFDRPVIFASYDDTTRPDAAEVGPGATIWNTDDAMLNISDGADWTLPDGTVT